MTPLYCSGCWKPMGWVQNRVPGYIFCSKDCAEQPSVFYNESRDALISFLAATGIAHDSIAKELGVTRARIQQVVKRRMEDLVAA